MEKKYKGILVIVIVLVTVITLAVIGLTINIKSLKSEINDNNEVNTGVDSSTESAKKVLDRLVGSWGTCDDAYECVMRTCYIKTITKENNEYKYSASLYQTGGGSYGTIIESKMINDDTIYLKVYFPKIDSEESLQLENTKEFLINISELNNNYAIFGNSKHEKISGTFEEFFKDKVYCD